MRGTHFLLFSNHMLTKYLQPLRMNTNVWPSSMFTQLNSFVHNKKIKFTKYNAYGERVWSMWRLQTSSCLHATWTPLKMLVYCFVWKRRFLSARSVRHTCDHYDQTALGPHRTWSPPPRTTRNPFIGSFAFEVSVILSVCLIVGDLGRQVQRCRPGPFLFWRTRRRRASCVWGPWTARTTVGAARYRRRCWCCCCQPRRKRPSNTRARWTFPNRRPVKLGWWTACCGPAIPHGRTTRRSSGPRWTVPVTNCARARLSRACSSAAAQDTWGTCRARNPSTTKRSDHSWWARTF